MKDKSSGKMMNMGQSSMDANMPQPKSMFPGEAKYTGNVKGSFPLLKQSVQAPTLGKAKGSASHVSGHTAKGLVIRSSPPATIKKTSRGR
jgi:hypothetical protein